VPRELDETCQQLGQETQRHGKYDRETIGHFNEQVRPQGVDRSPILCIYGLLSGHQQFA
jgi:hypothetical protein